MQTIRNNFQGKIITSVSNAVGTSVVLQLGINHHAALAQQTPNARLVVGAGSPRQSGVRTVQVAPTHAAIQQVLQQNRNILYELYLSELIQHWFDLLSDLYQKIISDKLRCMGNYTPPKIKIRLDFDEASKNVVRHIEEITKNKFDFFARG